MSLHEEREALQNEKQTYLERLEKLEGRKDKVKPQLYEKLRGEIDDKIVDVDTRLAEVEQQILEEEKAAEEAAMQERESERRQIILDKYADELQALQNEWQATQDASRKELQDHSNNLHHQRQELEEKLPGLKDEVEELDLRHEIGEFDDNEDEYQAEAARLKNDQEQIEADMSAVDNEISQVGEQLEALDNEDMPDFTEQVIENHADELTAPEPEPEEEVYEPPAEEEVYEPGAEEEVYEPESEEVVEEKIVTEEEISADQLADGEEVITEEETVYEDEAEEAFFSGGGDNLITATINPCLIERLPDNSEKIHELVLGGAKTLVGASEICDVYLPYPSVDSKHAWIKVDRKAQYLIKDLGSKTGTYVNGKKVKKGYLQNGDQVRFGEIRLTVKLI